MPNRARKGKKLDATTIVTASIGAGVWCFLSSDPSALALMIAALLLCYVVLIYCLIAIYLPQLDPADPSSQPSPSFAKADPVPPLFLP